MASNHNRPGRTLVAFFLGSLLLFGLVALTDTWKPALGLDLQGGQRITLVAKGSPSEDQLAEAASIINRRVNASGTAEADVNTQGDDRVVVEIPGDANQDLVDIVQRQARLGFRLLACSDEPGRNVGTCDSGLGTDPLAAAPRPAPEGLKQAPSDEPSDEPSATTSPTATGSASPSATEETEATPAKDLKSALAWRAAPPADWVDRYTSAVCDDKGQVTIDGKPLDEDADAPDTPLVACSAAEKGADGEWGTQDDRPAVKYLLSAAVLEGSDLDGAEPGQEQTSLDYVVNLEFEDDGAKRFAAVSKTLYSSTQPGATCNDTGAQGCEQFAMVLDGEVISAPTMNDPNLSDVATISGNMGQQEATDLATSLKFGALPVAFEKNPRNITIGPSLAGNQLSAGIWAGVVGLLLVMVYCLVYYRGLGAVVISSLVAAGVLTWGMVLLLSSSGFTLSLPGIAGLIVAVGITADSFIVFFERIRDEMRDGKSMRVAVESGWLRARNTCLAADAVSLSAAVVLYIFAIDEVRGFAFTLGLSTLIDLVVFFWFTKPMVSWLGRFKFFSHGHPLSGLGANTLGVDAITTAPATARGGN